MKIYIKYRTDTAAFTANGKMEHQLLLCTALTLLENQLQAGCSGQVTPIRDSAGVVVGTVGVSR